MRGFGAALRGHRHFFILTALLILIMTFPTIVYVFNTEVFWLPTGNHPDTWMKFWDAWYGKRMLAGQADYYYTDLLFYPKGVSLVFHNFSWPHMLVFGGLQAFMPPSNAYSLTFLLIVAAVCCSAYVYMLYLFKDKWLALLGAVVIGLSPHVVGYPEHPEYRFIATVPLALYYFHRGMDERRMRFVFYSALLTGVTAYVSMHVAVCLVITLGMYILYFAARRWRNPSFWAAMLLFAAVAAAVSSFRVLPMLASARHFDDALADKVEVNNDLLEYFVNARHPLTKALFPSQSFLWGYSEKSARYSSYLGYFVLFLIGLGLLSKRYRRRMLPWLAVAFPFLLLRLGSVLTIGGVEYPEFPLPKRYLDELIPGVTEGFRLISAFHLGALIPLGALACYGASALLRGLGKDRRPLAILIVIGIVCFEYYQPMRQATLGEEEFAFADWLKRAPGDVRLIDLPFDGSAKVKNLLFQTQHGYPTAGGHVARVPPYARDYIDGNFALDSWRNQRTASCSWQTRDDYLPALERLLTDGFTHVVVHGHDIFDLKVAVSFIGVEPAWQDDYTTIYSLEDLLAPCESGYLEEFFASFPYADLYLMPSIIHERNGLVMSFHESRGADDAFMSYFSRVAFDRKDMVHFSADEAGALVAQSSNYLLANPENIAGAYGGIWLINDPQATDLPRLPVFSDWFTANYRFCKRFLEREDATIDLYLKPDIPCVALDDARELGAQYDNGARLHSLTTELEADRLLVASAWTLMGEGDASMSLQFFDEAGEKALQYDDFIHRDVVNANYVDVARLPAGVYELRLIVYDSETGASEGGVALESGERFERMLHIGSIEIGRGG